MIGKDRICAVVAAADARSMWEQLRRALQLTSVVEVRLDWLAQDAERKKFFSRMAKARPHAILIATCRRFEAGGKFRGTMGQQLVQLSEAIHAGCAWYDLEIETS